MVIAAENQIPAGQNVKDNDGEFLDGSVSSFIDDQRKAMGAGQIMPGSQEDFLQQVGQFGDRILFETDRFNIDAEGHILDSAVGEALTGLHRFSPKVTFLGSYPRADRVQTKPEGNNSNGEFATAETWLKNLRAGR